MDTAQLAELVGERLPLITTAVLVSAAVIIYQLGFNDPLAGLPRIGREIGGRSKQRKAYQSKAKHLYYEGYNTFKDTIARLTTAKNAEIVVVPPQFLPELKALPDDTLSFRAAIAESMESKYTNIKGEQGLIVHSVKTALTPALNRINPYLTEEVDRTLREEIPLNKDWTEVNVYKTLLRIVAIVSGRVFIGPELCHDETYIDAAVNYTRDVMVARGMIQFLPPWSRWIIAPWLPQVRRLASREQDLKDYLRPIIAARRQAEREQPGYQKPDDMLQWLMDGEHKFGEKEDVEIAKAQLSLSFAAIHTTTLTTTNAFYNLAAYPEIVPELRQEIREVLAANNGTFTTSALQSLKKMDSFLKETMRVHPASFASFARKVLKPITLSNGQVIPAGVTIEVPLYGITRDEATFPDANTFDPLRFYRMREAGETFNPNRGGMLAPSTEAAAHNQFVSVSPNSLLFGYGRHACPGRFFAANEIKMILARAILTWDIRNVGMGTERYPNIEYTSMSIPDPKRQLLFREVQE